MGIDTLLRICSIVRFPITDFVLAAVTPFGRKLSAGPHIEHIATSWGRTEQSGPSSVVPRCNPNVLLLQLTHAHKCRAKATQLSRLRPCQIGNMLCSDNDLRCAFSDVSFEDFVSADDRLGLWATGRRRHVKLYVSSLSMITAYFKQ